MKSGTVTITYCGTEYKIEHWIDAETGFDWKPTHRSGQKIIAEQAYQLYNDDCRDGEITRLIKQAITEKENV